MQTSSAATLHARSRLTRLCLGWLDRLANGKAHAAKARETGEPSLSSLVMLVVLKSTCLALLLSGLGLMIYEVRTYRTAMLDELRSQADIIARINTPALSFKDDSAATNSLGMLRLHPQITAAAIYLVDEGLFASYLQPGVEQPALPVSVRYAGHEMRGGAVEFFHPIRQNGQTLGVLYLRARQDAVGGPGSYVLMLLTVTAASLLVAMFIASRMQRAVTTPILQVAQVAHDVVARRDFSLRASQTSCDEVGRLVEGFNGVLAEMEAGAAALQQAHQHLSLEMSERSKAEAALKELASKKDAFLAMLAHELRNPLAPITHSMEILRRTGQQDSALRHRALDIMQRQLRQLVRLIDDLLDVSRITTGKLVLHTEQADLVRILQDALEATAPLLESRHHVLDVRLPSGPVSLQADAMRLCQVFSNLLNNAGKYTADGGLISLRMRATDEEVEVSLRDNGIGIPEAMRQAVFDMFVQLDGEQDSEPGGLGVGLYLARELIRLHGGSIQLNDRSPHRGSEFIVRLPRHEKSGHAKCLA